MTNYSLADTETDLKLLVEKALEGEDVVITRQGEPVATLKSVMQNSGSAADGHYSWLRARRATRKGVGISSVELLNLINDDTAA